MKAIQVVDGRLVWTDVPDPVAGPEEVIVRVRAAGVNRADLLQAKGAYPPPPGASPILGLEAAGTVKDTGQRVCTLLPGGGYAEEVAIHRDMLMALPDDWTFEMGAAMPEVWYTAFTNLHPYLQPGTVVLIHAAASGVGTTAIQLAKQSGAIVIGTAGSQEKCDACRALGADLMVNYKLEDFPSKALEFTAGRGVDLIFDCVGGKYLRANIELLVRGGTLIVIGLLGGSRADLDLARVLTRQLTIRGTTVRSQSIPTHIGTRRALEQHVWPRLIRGEYKLVLDRVFNIEETSTAHHYMSENRNTGKVVLRVRDNSD